MSKSRNELDFRTPLRQFALMSIARIIEVQRKTTQSGRAKDGLWQLEFERTEALEPDPLTGWAGSGDTGTQVRLNFASQQDAIAYCTRNGLDYHLVPAAPVKLKIQAYADNFR
jgi:hypothetical protein